MRDEFLTIQRAADLLGVSTKTLRRWEARGVLVAARTVGNQRRYKLQELQLFKSQGMQRFPANVTPVPEAPSSSIQTVQSLPQESTAPKYNFHEAKPIANNVTVQPEISTSQDRVKLLQKAVFKNSLIPRLPLAFAGLLLIAGIALFGSLNQPKETDVLLLKKDSSGITWDMKSVLAAETKGRNLFGDITFNIPALFTNNVTIKDDFIVNGKSLFTEDIRVENKNIDLGTGRLTASNVVYGLTAGANITISGDPQNPTIEANLAGITGGVSSIQGQTGPLVLAEGSGIGLNGLEISNTGVLSLGGQTGDVDFIAGSGIGIDGVKITNSDPGSAQNIFKTIAVGSSNIVAGSNNDMLTFIAGSNVTLTPDTSGKSITISSTTAGASQWTTVGADIYYNLGNVGIGTTTPGAALDVVGNIRTSGNATVSGSLTLAGLTQGILRSDTSGTITAAPVDLAANGTDVSGIVGVANGGTGISATPLNGQILIGNGSNYSLGALTGTANQISISNGSGSITFSTPQDIDPNANPTFAALNLTNTTNQIILGTGNTGAVTTEALTTPRTYTFPDASGVVCLSSGNCGSGGGGGTIVGSGTANYIVKFTSATGISDSLLYESGGKLGLGTISPQGLFHVSGAPTGQALAVLNYSGSSNNILVGSNSGTTRFAFDAAGNLNLTNGSYQIGGSSVLNATTIGAGILNSSLTTVGALASGSITSGFGNIDNGTDSISGGDFTSVGSGGFGATGNSADFTFSGMGNHDITASAGVLRFGASTLLGDITGNNQSITDLNNLSADGGITFSGLSTGIVQSNGSGVLSSSALNLAGGASYITGVLPVANGGTGLSSFTTGDLVYASDSNTLASLPIGSNGNVLTVTGGVPTWSPGSALSFWQRNSGALSPLSIGDDLLVGGTSTASARFQVVSGTGNATTSGTFTFNTAGSIQTTNNQTLTLGGTTTGNITLSPRSGSGTVFSTGNLSLSSGRTYQINGTNVLSSTALGSGVTSSSLTTVGALASGSIANGFGTISTTNNITGADIIANDNLRTGPGVGSIRITDNGNLVNIGSTELNGITYSWPGADGAGSDYVLTTDGAGGLTWQNVTSVGGAGDITAIGDVTSGAAFTSGGTQGTSLYFYDPDGRGQLTTANLSQVRTYTLPDASGTVCLTSGNCAGVGGSISGAGTAGQIAYFNGAGSIESEATGFAWDSANNKLGIGTDTPSGKLTVSGAATGNALVVFNETSGQSILTASASGNTMLVLNSSGDLAIEGQLSDLTQNMVTVNDNLNLVSGNNYQINGTNVLSSNALGTGVTSSSLTSVGTLASGSITSGFGSITTSNAIEGSILTANGNGAGLTFSGTGNHDIAASSGTLRLSATTLTGTITGNSQSITGLNNFSAGGTITLGSFSSNGGILYTNSSGQVLQVPAGTSTQILKGGTSPSFGAVVLTTDVSGTLPIASGGTNANSIGSAGSVVYSNGTAYNFTGVGSNGQVLVSNGSSAPTWLDAAGIGTNYFQRNAGVVAPLNLTDDLLVGGSSTSSARFQISGTTGNASTSGNLTFNSTASVQSTNNQSLTLGGNSTGNIIFSPLNGAGSVQINGNLNLASGRIYRINGNDVLTETALGNGVIGSQLTQVGALTSGSIATGFGAIDTANTITGTSLNGTTGINTGASGGTQRIDNTGNLVNIETIGSTYLTTSTNVVNIAASTALQFDGTTIINASRQFQNIAGVSTNLTPTAANTYSLATGTGNQYQNIYGQSIYQNGNQVCDNSGNCSASTNYFQLNSGSIAPGNAANIADKLVLGGNSTTPFQFEVNGRQSGKALASLNETGDQDIFTASGSGTTRFTIANNGDIRVNNLTNCTALETDGTGLIGCGVDDIGVGAANYWQLSNGAISPFSTTADFLVGGTSTASAKFAFINSIGSGTPTASIAGTPDNALFLTGDGNIGTTNSQTLTLGGPTTGNVMVNNDFLVSNLVNCDTIDTDASGKFVCGNDAGGAGGAGIINVQNNGVSVGTVDTLNFSSLFTLTTSPSTTAQVTLANDGLNFAQFADNMTLDAATSVALGGFDFSLGTNTGNGGVVIAPNAGGKSALIVNKQGSGDIFSASASGTTRLTLSNGGNLNLVGGVYQSNGTNGVTVGTAACVTTSGGIVTGTAACPSITANDIWRTGNGTIYQGNTTQDFLIGGTATVSAKFAVTNISGNGSPTASLSAGVSGGAVLTAAGSLQTTARQTLTLGGGNTGNITLDSGNGSINLVDATNLTSSLTQTGGAQVTLSGNVDTTNGLDVTGANLTVGGSNATISTTGVITGITINATSALQTAGTSRIDNSGNLTSIGTIDSTYIDAASNNVNIASGTGLQFNGTTVLDSSRNLSNIAGVATDLNPTTPNTRALGSSTGNQYNTIYGNQIYQNGNQVCDNSGNCAGTTNYLQLNSGNLAPGNAASVTDRFVLGGSTTTPFQLGVNGRQTGKALVGLNETGNQDILTGSASGTTQFIFDRSGNLAIEGQLSDLTGGTLTINDDLQIIGNDISDSGSTNRISLGATTTLTNTTLALSGTTSITGGPTAIDFAEFDVSGTTGSITINDGGDAGNISIEGTILDINSLDFNGAGTITAAGADITLSPGGGDVYISNGSTINIGGHAGGVAYNTISDAGGSPVSGQVNSDDDLYVEGVIEAAALYQGANQVCDTSGNCAGLTTTYWNQNNGVLSPKNTTVDFLVGGISTASAKFGILNVNSGTPTASFSAGAAGGSFLTASGTLQTTARQSLTLGGGNTGNIVLGGFGVGVLQTNASGVVSTGTVNVASGGTGTTSLTQGGVLYGNGTSALGASSQGLSNQALISGGSGAPTWTTGTLTLDGNFRVANANALTLTTSGTTNVTLPTTGTLATLTGAETFTNKTLTAPRFADLGFIADANGNEMLIFDTVASAVNEITFANATTTTGPTIAATGADTNIALSLDTKGSGNLNLNGNATGNILLGGGSGSTGCTVTNASGAFACTGAISASNITGTSSGTNTGDQIITLTGDVTGSGTGSFATTIENDAVDGSNISLTGEAQGNIMYFDGTDWVRLANGTTNQVLHSGTTPSWGAVNLAAEVSGTLPIANGGTNSSATPTNGGIAYGTGTAYAFTGAGSIGNCLLSNGASAPTWGSCASGATNTWQINNGAISPYSSTLDLLVGSAATTSAKFSVLNMTGSGTPTASVSAVGTTGNGIVLGGDSTIQSLKRSTLTIGGNTTGNILLNPAGGTGLINANGDINLTSGLSYQINGTDVLSGGALGSGVTGSSLTSVGALGTGSITAGFGAIDVGSDSITGGDITSAGTTGFVANNTGAGLNFSGAGTHIIQASAGTLQLNAVTLGGTVAGNLQTISGLGQLTVDNLRMDNNTLDTTSGDLTLNAAGGDIIFSNATTLNIGGNGSDVAYNAIGDNLSGATASFVNSDDDLYIGGNLEVDGFVNALDIRSTEGTRPAASVSAQTTYAAMTVNNNGNGDIFTASKSGKTHFTIRNSGAVVIGNTTDGITFDVNNPDTKFTGSARPTRQIKLSPEYAGAVLTASGSANTNGFMTSDASPSAALSNYQTYYEWTSAQTSLQDYTVAVRFTLPQDFGAWAGNNAITVGYNTELVGVNSNKLDLIIYNTDTALGANMVVFQRDKTTAAKTWTNFVIDDSDLTDGTMALDTAGETAVLYLKMYSRDNNHVQIGDITLNYLGRN